MDEESEEGTDDLVDTEPQVTSLDPNERKLARKLRIERRLENIRRQNLPEGEEEEEVVEKTLLQQQELRSAELLEQLVIDAEEYVSNVRIANDGREADRRDEEGVGREKIIDKLEEEAAAAEEIFNEIAEKWEGIMKYHDPLHINEDMISQKEKCDELIKQKDGIIAMLRDEIRTSEINFSKDQRKQNEDIETLAKRIEKQITLMRRAYRQELQFIEDVVMIERQILVESNNRKWEELHKKRDQEEECNCHKKFEQLEEFEEMMQNLRRDFQEKYRETKIKLENDVENLQHELEKIKALSLLNSEKLDYNYQILKKREDENIIIRSQQKRRINKLQDVINDTRRKTADYETSSKVKIDRLIEEVHKLRLSVFEIEKTADRFQKNNDLKYKQVWDLNNSRASRILEKILTTDRVLYEQQLGLKWIPPERKTMKKTELPSYKSALEVVSAMLKKASSKTTSETTISKQRESVSTSKEFSEEDSSLTKIGETLAYRKLLRHILHQISDKTGFLIDERLKVILKPYLDDEKTLVRVDTVFAAMDVTQKEDIEIMLQFFLPYSHCPLCTGSITNATAKSSDSEVILQNITDFDYSYASTMSEPDKDSRKNSPTVMTEILSAIYQPPSIINEILSTVTDGALLPIQAELNPETFLGPSDLSLNKSGATKRTTIRSIKQQANMTEKLVCQYHHPLVISSVYVLRALKEFISKFYVPTGAIETMSSRLSYKRSTISRLMEGEDVIMFWERYKNIFNEQRLQVWNGLYAGLHKYHAILKDRKKLHEEVVQLRRQNVELKNLLASYVAKSKKMKPPCASQREVPFRSSPEQNRIRKL